MNPLKDPKVKPLLMELEGKVAIVTGGANGIGYACVHELLSRGVQYVIIIDMNINSGQRALINFKKEFGKDRTVFVKCDVTKACELENVFKLTLTKFRVIDIVVNNAGIMDEENWEQMMTTNVMGVVRGTHLGLKYMSVEFGGRGGVIVNIASIMGLEAFAGCPIYVGTKHFIVGFSRSYGMPWHYNRTGVRVMSLSPGFTETGGLLPNLPKGNNVYLKDMREECLREINLLPFQNAKNVGKGLVYVIKYGESGTIWVAETDDPAYEIVIPKRCTLVRKPEGKVYKNSCIPEKCID